MGSYISKKSTFLYSHLFHLLSCHLGFVVFCLYLQYAFTSKNDSAVGTSSLNSQSQVCSRASWVFWQLPSGKLSFPAVAQHRVCSMKEIEKQEIGIDATTERSVSSASTGPVCSISLSVWCYKSNKKEFSSSQLPHTGYFPPLVTILCKSFRWWCCGENPGRSTDNELLDRRPATMSSPFGLFWCSVWTSTNPLQHIYCTCLNVKSCYHVIG